MQNELSTENLNDNFNLEDDLHNGQIYLIKNNSNGKCYIGQAMCFTGSNNARWGTLGRWKSHIREATRSNQDHCVLLNNAIRKYREDNFEVLTLMKCHNSELNDYEIKFIEDFNCVTPHGYNLKKGGYSSKNNEETILKMKAAHSGKEHSEKTKEKIGKSQIGNRRSSKKRTHEEDNILPKYVRVIRRNNIITGYSISCFPIGINEKEYLKDIFFPLTKYITKEKALEETIKHLSILKEQYKFVDEETNILKEKIVQLSITEKKENLIKDKLPEYIYPITEKYKIKGYYVDGIYDKEGNPYPKKEFIGKTNRWNLNDAKKYVEQLLYYHANNIDITNFEEIEVSGKNNKVLHEKYHLPKYVNIYNVKGEMKGFMINGYPMDKYKCGKYKKAFGNEDLTIDENYENCIKHLEEIKIKYPINKEQITIV